MLSKRGISGSIEWNEMTNENAVYIYMLFSNTTHHNSSLAMPYPPCPPTSTIFLRISGSCSKTCHVCTRLGHHHRLIASSTRSQTIRTAVVATRTAHQARFFPKSSVKARLTEKEGLGEYIAERRRFQIHQPAIVMKHPTRGIQVL